MAGGHGPGPSDPRFERAVRVALRACAGNRQVSDADREDIAQEVRIAVWLKNGPPPARVAGWAVADWARREWGTGPNKWGRRSREVLGWQGEPGGPCSGLSPEAQVDLQRALAKLPPEACVMLRLRHLYGMSQREVGLEVGMSESGASRALRRAERAAACLQGCVGDCDRRCDLFPDGEPI